VWCCYDASVWTPWSAFAGGTNSPFPAAGPVKPQYNYAGADAAVRIEAETQRLTPGSRTTAVRWTAAAKPLGYLELDEGVARPDACSLVLPAFHDVRLIPVDASSAPSGGAFNLAWRRHIEEHLPEYMQAGPSAVSEGCWYCRQLIAWEDAEFRRSGVEWLAEYSDTCETGGGGGVGGHAGGTRRGH